MGVMVQMTVILSSVPPNLCPIEIYQEAKVIWQRLHQMQYTHCTRRNVQIQRFQRYEGVPKFKSGSQDPDRDPYDLLF